MLTGRVVGTVGRVLAQTGTPVPQEGRVRFTAQVGDHAVGGVWIVPSPVECQLDEEGRILDPTDPAGERLGVELDAWENVDGGFTYRVEIVSPAIVTRVLHLAVHANQTVDIATAIHVPSQPGTVISTLQACIDTIQGWLADPEFLRGAKGDQGPTGDSGVSWDENGRPYVIRPTEGQ